MKFSFKAFIFAIMFCAVIISAKNIYSCDLSAQIDKGIQRAANLKNIENLYIGSSLFRKGIYITSDKDFLIHYNGIDPANESLIVEYLIQSGLVIKNLYIDMNAAAACNVPWLSETRMIFDSPLSLKMNIIKLINKNPKANIISTNWELFISSGNNLFILWPLYKFFAENRYYKGGYTPENYSAGTTEEILKSKNLQNFTAVKMNPVEKEAIIKIIELCKNNNFNIIFLEIPKYKTMAENPNYITVMHEYINTVTELGAECILFDGTMKQLNLHDGKNIKSYEFPNGDASLFEDYIHLSTDGSRKLVNALKL